MASNTGSPPRVRGKRWDTVNNWIGHRITPACAGKTSCRHAERRCNEDHPRVCGENSSCVIKVSSTPGSPPRVRGKPERFTRLRQRMRITPACAGKTFSQFWDLQFVRDHPRVCGENQIIRVRALDNVGSPPRVRGKQSPLFPNARNSRITPACAGKTRRAGGGFSLF